MARMRPKLRKVPTGETLLRTCIKTKAHVLGFDAERGLTALGCLDDAPEARWEDCNMDKIIFICTGNTCRSPMAEGLFRAHGGEEQTGLAAASAGLFTQDGMPASQNAITAAKELGADITGHRSRMLTPDLAHEARYLVCMTGAHYDRLCELFPDCTDKIFTLTGRDISDPFGGDLEIYRRAAAEIDAGVRSIIERLKK